MWREGADVLVLPAGGRGSVARRRDALARRSRLLGRDLHEALQHGLLAAGMSLPRKGVLLSLGPVADKYWFADEARIIATELRLPIYATAAPPTCSLR